MILLEYVKESDRLTLGMKVNIYKLPFYFVDLKASQSSQSLVCCSSDMSIS
ncbi:MAG: hypothetical protein HWQ38_19330 [Nostoc sp. NMS7]|uniref:hypothetical protein n=1 Tax=Nostoc sp. NMS7 TaxID=2815391 RepID=UPI0025D90D04|nr:hypothetical protein [Nostoc sp. NMS7]MBN3948488.1 hypothetical protein [Nostoc sp. NMS7]